MTYEYKITHAIHVDIDGIAPIADTAPNQEQTAIQAEQRQHIYNALRSLLMNTRTVEILWALYFEDMTTAETAERFELSVSRIKEIRREALAVLRQYPNIRALLQSH